MATDDLHTRIAAEIERRVAVARAAQAVNMSGTWEASAEVTVEQANAVAAFWKDVTSATDALRRYERDRRVLERHAPTQWGEFAVCDGCTGDKIGWPCVEFTDLAESYSVEEE